MSGANLEGIQEALRAHFPGATGLTPVPTGKFNQSFFLRAGERDLVLRVAPPDDAVFLFYERRMMRQEPALHARLRERTDVPVPAVLVADFSRRHLDRDFLILERLPGRPLSEVPRTDPRPVFRAVGAALAQVHAITAEKYGYLGEHHCMAPQPTWEDAFFLMWDKLLADVEGVGHYSAPERRDLTRLLADHRTCFQHQPPSCLLHMDVWSQNMLVQDGRLSGLIDWDRACWGDPEIEFAVLDYCGVSEPPFWAGYGQRRDGSREARVRQFFYLLYELQKYIVIREGRNRDRPGARAYKAQTMRLIREFRGG